MAVTPYPVSYNIARPERYNRWTVFFRSILVIPHSILIGGIPFTIFGFVFGRDSMVSRVVLPVLSRISLSTILLLLVLLAWFAILFTGRFSRTRLWLSLAIFRWIENVSAYVLLQAAPYPPFGDRPYPLVIEIVPAKHYNRLSVFFRSVLVIPHLFVLFFLVLAQGVVTIIAWFAILFTGQYPSALYDFSVGVSRWNARVQAYWYLFVDGYPPFSLGDAPGVEPASILPSSPDALPSTS